jgi:anti-sigma28 factor (negative regulator of flagellin synthesis)
MQLMDRVPLQLIRSFCDRLSLPASILKRRDPHMDVNGIDSVQHSIPVNPVGSVNAAQPVTDIDTSIPVDQVELSDIPDLVAELDGPSEVRAERLAQIKAAVDDGTYETADKLQSAVDRLLLDLD